MGHPPSPLAQAGTDPNYGLTATRTVPPETVRDLANGTALKPHPADKQEERTLQKLDPADYPTD